MSRVVVFIFLTSFIESSDNTVTWKYTTVGCPINLGALFLSYCFIRNGIMSAISRLNSLAISSALSVVFLE